MYANRNFLQYHILSCLTIWRDAYGIVKLVDNVLGNSRKDDFSHLRVHNEKDNDKKMDANIIQCLYKGADGRFTMTRSVEIIRSDLYNGDIMKLPSCRPPCFLKLPWWLKLTVFLGALNRFPNTY